MNFAAITPLNGPRHCPQLLFTREAWQGSLAFQGAVLDGEGMALFLPLVQAGVIDELYLAIAPADISSLSLTVEVGCMTSGAGALVSAVCVAQRSDGMEQVLTTGIDAASVGGQLVLDKLARQVRTGILVLDPHSGQVLDEQILELGEAQRRSLRALRAQTEKQRPMTEQQLRLSHSRLTEQALGPNPLALELDIGARRGHNAP